MPTSWRDRSAPSAAGALNRFRERAGRRRLANNACSPTRWPGTALSVLAATRQACPSPCAGCTALTDTSLAASFSRRGGLASVARERESD